MKQSIPTASWSEVELGDICSKVTVGHVGPMASEYVAKGIPFLRSQNVKPYRLDLSDVKYISEEFHQRLKKSSLEPGDVVIVRTGNPGTSAVIPDWLEVSNCADLVIIRPGPNINSRYLAYYLNATAQHYINAHIVGAVQQHFNVGSAKSLKLSLPSIDEQNSMVRILGSIDDKIDLNRRMNETLEELARAIFKSWFIDFDPVMAKAEGKRPIGMDAQTAALFPDSFYDSELGEIPDEWEVSTIGEEVKAVGGGTPSTREPEYWEGGMHHWATPKDLSKLVDPILLDTERKITGKGLSKISSGLLPVGTVLLSSRAPIGYLALAKVPVAVNQGFIAMICEKRLSNYYMMQWAYWNMDTIKANAGGTTFQEISKTNFRPIEILVPPSAVMDSYNRLVAPLYKKIAANAIESNTLAQIRELLLPKLLSGEIRLKQSI